MHFHALRKVELFHVNVDGSCYGPPGAECLQASGHLVNAPRLLDLTRRATESAVNPHYTLDWRAFVVWWVAIPSYQRNRALYGPHVRSRESKAVLNACGLSKFGM